MASADLSQWRRIMIRQLLIWFSLFTLVFSHARLPFVSPERHPLDNHKMYNQNWVYHPNKKAAYVWYFCLKLLELEPGPKLNPTKFWNRHEQLLISCSAHTSNFIRSNSKKILPCLLSLNTLWSCFYSVLYISDLPISCHRLIWEIPRNFAWATKKL